MADWYQYQPFGIHTSNTLPKFVNDKNHQMWIGSTNKYGNIFRFLFHFLKKPKAVITDATTNVNKYYYDGLNLNTLENNKTKEKVLKITSMLKGKGFDKDFRFITHNQIPAGDGGVAFGQSIIGGFF